VIVGLRGREVTIEVDSSLGLPGIRIVGLPDAAVREAAERVRAAIVNSGYDIPPRKLTVNLAPADVRKAGPVYDLPIAVGIIMALGLAERGAPYKGYWLIGELSLTGEVRPISGALPLALAAAEVGAPGILVPRQNAVEAAGAGVNVIPINNLFEALELIAGKRRIDPEPGRVPAEREAIGPDFADIKGQPQARRALEIAAAGRHNLLMVGPPGSGKSMLARRLISILPPMSLPEAIEVTKVHSICGYTREGGGLVWERPFRAPHHTISASGLAGGGHPIGPGEISLSHRGVLFLDELPEFGPRILQVLRQPLEANEVTVVRASGSLTFPADFMFVAAMNSCPCGYLGDTRRDCECGESRIRSYRSRLSGPLLDRLDMHIEVPRLTHKEIMSPGASESSASIRQRVLAARTVQRNRFNDPLAVNSRLSPKDVGRYCALSGVTRTWFAQAIDKLALSARASDRILRMARTIADLAEEEEIGMAHLAEAVQYRTWELK
jgi:magnesium chelatase family protein